MSADLVPDARLAAVDAAVDDDALRAAVDVVVAQRVAGGVGTLRRRLASSAALSSVSRTLLVVGIIRLGEDTLLREVARALRHDEAAVVVGAARALALVGDRRAVPNLVEALQTDDVVVGAAVIEALGVLGDPACVPWLLAAARHRFCVEAACRALGRVGDNDVVAVLTALRDDDDGAVALAAAQGLARLQERGFG